MASMIYRFGGILTPRHPSVQAANAQKESLKQSVGMCALKPTKKGVLLFKKRTQSHNFITNNKHSN